MQDAYREDDSYPSRPLWKRNKKLNATPDANPSKNLITRVVPEDVIKIIFNMLPPSYRFIAPVSREFRDIYNEISVDEKKQCTFEGITEKISSEQRKTQVHYMASLAALKICLNELKMCKSRELFASRIGAQSGRIDLIQWAGKWDKRTIAAGARGGHRHVVEWLRGQDCGWDWRTCKAAAEGGHLNVLIWAVSHGCEWNAGTCYAAAGGGHLEVLRWAQGMGCEWTSATCRAAAAGGHLELLRWARGKGCEWNRMTCHAAVQGGHLELLRWAIENGCNYYERHFDTILDENFLEWFEAYKIEAESLEN